MNYLDLTAKIWFLLLELKAKPPSTLGPFLLDLPAIFNSSNIQGIISSPSLVVSGFETIQLGDNLFTHVIVTPDENDSEIFKICINFPMGRLDINVPEYFMDIAINNTIPVYGEGQFGLSFTDIQIDYCARMNYNENHSDDTVLSMRYRYVPMVVTGLYKNSDGNELILKALNIANILVAVWNYYEPQKALGCILGPVIEYTINDYYKYPENKFKYDPNCFEESWVSYLKQLLQEIQTELPFL